ncbi:MAG: DUF362 domain-containing protein, partial [Bacteroidales bacterium]|nr:DUF362 domain-containing protein [Bacteroidales bacterium]
FLKKSIGAGVFAGSMASLGSGRIFANTVNNNSLPYDLVAIREGTPEKMFDRAIETMGGMKNFVKSGQTVVVKPNIGWDVPPERGGNTNPALVKRIVEHCFEAGAKRVYVFDNPVDEWRKAYDTSGIEKAAKDAGAKVAPANTEGYFQEVDIPRGKTLKKAKEHELALESDVFINVPVLKTHNSSILTISMKNLMGNVWDRGFYHRNGLHQCIADFITHRKPDLNIVDAYRVMRRNGPRGVSTNDVALMKYQIISDDIVAADAAATKIFGKEVNNISHIDMAGKMGVGETDLSNLNIERIKM